MEWWNNGVVVAIIAVALSQGGHLSAQLVEKREQTQKLLTRWCGLGRGRIPLRSGGPSRGWEARRRRWLGP